MTSSPFSNKRPGATVAGIFSLTLASLVLLCGAGSVPIENFSPQGPMQADLNAGGHNLTNAATISAANFAGGGAGVTNVAGFHVNVPQGYLMFSFENSSGLGIGGGFGSGLERGVVAASKDGVTFNAIRNGLQNFTPPTVTVGSTTYQVGMRDAGGIKYQGVYLIAYTQFGNGDVTPDSVGVISSTDLVNWSTVATPSDSRGTEMFTPKLFLDPATGILHMTYLEQISGTNYICICDCTGGAGATWGNFRTVTTTGGAGIPAVDPTMLKVGSQYVLYFTAGGALAYYATSGTIDSGYSSSTEITPWVTSDQIEGTAVCPTTAGGYRAWFWDVTASQEKTSTSTDGFTWSSPANANIYGWLTGGNSSVIPILDNDTQTTVSQAQVQGQTMTVGYNNPSSAKQQLLTYYDQLSVGGGLTNPVTPQSLGMTYSNTVERYSVFSTPVGTGAVGPHHLLLATGDTTDPNQNMGEIDFAQSNAMTNLGPAGYSDNKAMIQGFSEGYYSGAGSQGGELIFSTKTANTNTTPVSVMQLHDTGDLLVGPAGTTDDGTDKLQVAGSVKATGTVTASGFVGSGAGITGLPQVIASGTATLSAGAVTVSAPNVTATSLCLAAVTGSSISANAGPVYPSAIVPGASGTVTFKCTNTASTDTIAWKVLQ